MTEAGDEAAMEGPGTGSDDAAVRPSQPGDGQGVRRPGAEDGQQRPGAGPGGAKSRGDWDPSQTKNKMGRKGAGRSGGKMGEGAAARTVANGPAKQRRPPKATAVTVPRTAVS